MEQRLVACAQASADGLLAVKTLKRCKALVEKMAEATATSVSWRAIGGNEGYLKWLEEECKGGK